MAEYEGKKHSEEGSFSWGMRARADYEGQPVVGHEYDVIVDIFGAGSLEDIYRSKSVAMIIHVDGALELASEEAPYKEVNLSEDLPETTFRIVAKSVGEGKVSVDSYYERHYLGTAEFVVKVQEVPGV